MSTETPETPVASTPPTPENVAEMPTSGDNDYHDGNYWHPSIGADGNVVHIGITAYSEDGEKLPEVHFRAVVVEGETVPDPAELERLRAQVESLKARLSSAESVMRQALADPVHETRTHLLGLYLAAAQSAQDGGDDA